MLVLTRRVAEEIVIGEGPSQVRLVIKRVKGKSVRVGIEAPGNVRVRRAELPELPQEQRIDIAHRMFQSHMALAK